MKIKLTRSIGGHNSGDTIDVTNGAAERLIEQGVAEKATARKAKADGEGGDSPSPRRALTAG